MAPLANEPRLVETIQSVPVDTTAPYSPATLKGKTILLTGGSSGLGAAFARHWASHGAHLIIGDVNTAAGESLAAELRTATSSPHHHFVHCDVTSWASQAALFRRAAELAGHIDAVVASAGVTDRHGAATGRGLENPSGLDAPDPPPPDLRCVEVNLTGMLYTAHLALFWLARGGGGGGGGSAAADRHFLIIGSSAGLYPLPGVPEYVTSKHGVTGLFRALRTLSWRKGIRVNMLCPYFIDTPILPNRAVAMLAGLGLGRIDDTVDAATRLMATGAAGRALMVGPRMNLLQKVLPVGEMGSYEDVEAAEAEGVAGHVLAGEDVAAQRGQAVWELYAHDYDTVDFFLRRYLRLLNTIAMIKGWIGFWKDLWYALFVRREPSK